MPSDMGNITGHMTGRVIRGEDIERVLAAIPEQVWAFDVDMPETDDFGTTWLPTSTEIPMRLRREIIAHVLCVLPD